jgi:hypothetical protein
MLQPEIKSRLKELTPDQLQELLLKVISVTTPQQPKKFLTSKEAGKVLGKTENAMRIMAYRNQIKNFKQGMKLYFLESDLIEWIESGRCATPIGVN